MLLAVQLAGVLAGACVLAAALGGRLDRRGLALGGAVVPVGLACVLLGATLYPTARNLLVEAQRNAAVTPQEADLIPGKSADVEVDFVEWARSQIPRGESFHVVTDDVDGYQWITYRLLPGLVTSADRADWIVFYGKVDPSDYDATRFESPRTFQDGFAVARRLR